MPYPLQIRIGLPWHKNWNGTYEHSVVFGQKVPINIFRLVILFSQLWLHGVYRGIIVPTEQLTMKFLLKKLSSFFKKGASVYEQFLGVQHWSYFLLISSSPHWQVVCFWKSVNTLINVSTCIQNLQMSLGHGRTKMQRKNSNV